MKILADSLDACTTATWPMAFAIVGGIIGVGFIFWALNR